MGPKKDLYLLSGIVYLRRAQKQEDYNNVIYEGVPLPALAVPSCMIH